MHTKASGSTTLKSQRQPLAVPERCFHAASNRGSTAPQMLGIASIRAVQHAERELRTSPRRAW